MSNKPKKSPLNDMQGMLNQLPPVGPDEVVNMIRGLDFSSRTTHVVNIDKYPTRSDPNVLQKALRIVHQVASKYINDGTLETVTGSYVPSKTERGGAVEVLLTSDVSQQEKHLKKAHTMGDLEFGDCSVVIKNRRGASIAKSIAVLDATSDLAHYKKTAKDFGLPNPFQKQDIISLKLPPPEKGETYSTKFFQDEEDEDGNITNPHGKNVVRVGHYIDTYTKTIGKGDDAVELPFTDGYIIIQLAIVGHKSRTTLRESGVSASASKRKNKMNAMNDMFSKAEEEEEKIPEGEEDTMDDEWAWIEIWVSDGWAFHMWLFPGQFYFCVAPDVW